MVQSRQDELPSVVENLQRFDLVVDALKRDMKNPASNDVRPVLVVAERLGAIVISLGFVKH